MSFFFILGKSELQWLFEAPLKSPSSISRLLLQSSLSLVSSLGVQSGLWVHFVFIGVAHVGKSFVLLTVFGCPTVLAESRGN